MEALVIICWIIYPLAGIGVGWTAHVWWTRRHTKAKILDVEGGDKR